MKKHYRDNRVSVLYCLENHELPSGAKFPDIAQAKSFVDFVVSSAFWKNNCSLPQIVHVYSLGDLDYSEARNRNEIWLANTQLNQQVVLHELAHFYPFPRDGHGPEFVRAYLGLISRFMGCEFSKLYREAFKREGIRFT